MSFSQLAVLQWQKAVRSASVGRKLVSSIALGIFGIIILLSILSLGIGLPSLIPKIAGTSDIASVISAYIIYFFLCEIIYRYFLQSLSGIELEHFLHLPVRRSKIIHFLLLKSFLSPFNLIAILLFAPSCAAQISGIYGAAGGLSWLLTIIFISWAIHWGMIWFQQKFGDRFISIVIIAAVFLAAIGSAWYGWFNIGAWVEPFFTAALQNPIPLLITFLLMIFTYTQSYRYYYQHAYLEELDTKDRKQITGDQFSLFGRFGLAGAVADLELKLALRHRRSRMAFILSLLFLGYGLVFYPDQTFSINQELPLISIFIGLLITGIFIMQYGRFFLSWNSSYFDFYLDRNQGIRALVRGKYMLLFGVSLAMYILSIPYIYFGWSILIVHTATFLFNIGINIHIIVYMALWKPEPMDLSKRGMLNYEGVGAAQFLMAIPMLALPFLIYLPLAYFVNDMAGLLALGLVGLAGLLFYNQFIDLQVQTILKNRYTISSSFRQEL
jgi:hypothetical protein